MQSRFKGANNDEFSVYFTPTPGIRYAPHLFGNRNTALVICAFLTCMGLTFLILACAVPTPKIFYPFFVLLFYALSVLPVFIAKRTVPNEETNPKTEFALFLTAGMVLSAFALPFVLAHASVITWTACTLTIISNLINYGTIFGYAMRDEEHYGSMF